MAALSTARMIPREIPVGRWTQCAPTILSANEHQNQRDRGLQVGEPFHGAGHDEEQGAQAENGEQVRGVNDERIPGDGEDRGDAVDREDQVAPLDDEQHQEERSRGSSPWRVGRRSAGRIGRSNRHQPLRYSHERILLWLDAVPTGLEHPDPGDDQDDTEDVDDPFQFLEQ